MPDLSPVRALSRRHLIFGIGGAAALALTGCNASARSAADAAPSGSASAAGFTFTDARGKVVDLATLPAVVVAQSSAAAALWDAGFKVQGVYGELKETDGKLDFQAGNLDLTGLTVIGDTYGQFNLEKYAAMGPQLLIDLSFDDKTLWYVPADSASKVEAIAPTLGAKMLGLNLAQIIDEFMGLATKLGADTASAEVTAAKAAFDAASETIRQIAASKKIVVTALSRDADKAYIANAKQHPDLAYLETLGVTFTDAKSKATDYFTEISYERLDEFGGDVVFDDSRGYAGRKDSEDEPTWKALAAVKAGQVYAWKPAAPYSYAVSAPILAEIAAVLTNAKAVTGS